MFFESLRADKKLSEGRRYSFLIFVDVLGVFQFFIIKNRAIFKIGLSIEAQVYIYIATQYIDFFTVHCLLMFSLFQWHNKKEGNVEKKRRFETLIIMQCCVRFFTRHLPLHENVHNFINKRMLIETTN